MSRITESDIESYALKWLEDQGFQYYYGPALAHDGENPLRQDYSQVVLSGKLSEALHAINPDLPDDAISQAIKEVERIQSSDLFKSNEDLHRFLTDGVPVTYRVNGEEKHDHCRLIDFQDPANNVFHAVNQFTIVENNHTKRPDVILFINGLPLVIIELKNAADENATTRKAFDQIQTYKSTIPGLFTYNAFCVVSDGLECRAGTISADFSRFMAWKTTDGKKEASRLEPQLKTLIRGMLNPATLLDLIQNFIVFGKHRKEDPKTGIIQMETIKKLAAYHQYFAVNKALASTQKASVPDGNRKGGVVWHTQGSGKSLSMVFFSGKMVQALSNPTILVITDRNDLDDQLFDTFASSRQLLRQEPVQAKDRDHLKELLKVASGGIVFTTIQKFFPDDIFDEKGNKTGRKKEVFDHLSARTNIVVIADEAHRTHYGFEARLIEERDKETREVTGQRMAYGFAKYMRDALPNATYVGFTGTPVENEDKNTRAVFGNYVDVYDILDAVEDGATVRIYYESRLAKVNLDEKGRRIIEEFDKDLEQEELTEKQKPRAKWTKLEAIVGHPDRLKNLARDIVDHFEKRQSAFEGKGMIVAMSRRIAAVLYEEIVKIRPNWHDEDLSEGVIKVVMTASSSDGPEMKKHHTTRKEHQALANRMKDPADPLQLVIVRDMWLTGFDAPGMHTLYVDKPMRGHNLMQAIARVNRVFKDKPGGLVVDYLGIAADLKKALSFYSDSGGKGDPVETQERAVEALMEKLEVVQQMFREQSRSQPGILVEESEAYYENANTFNYKRFFSVSPSEKLGIILQAEEHILGLDKGKERFIKEVTLLSRVFALSVPHERTLEVKDEVAFFQAVKARLAKFDAPAGGGRSDAEMESAIRQVINEALSSDNIIDIFDAAGLQKPEISILSEDFLMEIKGMKHQNLALELLKKLLNDEIKVRAKHNLVKSKALLEVLETAVKKYQNGLLTTAEIIQELIDLAKEITEADKRGEQMGLNKDELAFMMPWK